MPDSPDDRRQIVQQSSVVEPAIVQDKPIELVNGQVIRLGGCVALDGRISWVPPTARGYQPVNCFLVLDQDDATLIDTGPVCHGPSVTAGLTAHLAPNQPLSVFLSRSEYDCIGNLAAAVSLADIKNLFTAGFSNPFDSFDEITSPYAVWADRVRLGLIERGTSVALGESRRISITPAPLKILPTYWAYDELTKTLFTSDSFGHGVLAGLDQPRVTTGADHEPREHVVSEYMRAKFAWLDKATDLAGLVEELDAVFARHDVQMIAPAHGTIICGRDAVVAHREVVRTVLADLASATRRRYAARAVAERVDVSPESWQSATPRATDRKSVV